MTIDFQRLADLAWNQTWQVTLVALVVAFIVKGFGQRRPHLAYLLWLLVIAKCLTPPVWSSPTGVFSWARMEKVVQLEGVVPDSSSVPPPVPADPQLPAFDGELEVAAFERDQLAPVETESRSPRESLVALQVPREEAARGDAVSVITDLRIDYNAAPAPTSLSLPWPVALAILWAAGAAICTATVLTRHGLCAWTIWRSSQPADKDLSKLVAKLSARLGVRRKVRLMVTRRPLGPAVFGILRPTILLPQTLTSPQFAKRIEAILAHELIHFRRGDTVLGVLQTAAQILWWFHPLVWWASLEATRERERCCDEEAVAGLACEPGDYAQTLLDVLRSKRKLEPVFAQPGVRPVDITARRLEHIMQADRRFHQRTPVWYWLCAVLAAALLLPGGGLVIEAGAASSDETPQEGVAIDVSVTAVQHNWAQYGGSSYRNNVSSDTNLPVSWDVETGLNIKWTAKLGTSVFSSPIVADGKVIIGTNNGAAYGQRLPAEVDASCLLCFDAKTGEFLWQHANEKLATGRAHDWPSIGLCSTSCVENGRLWYVNNRNELVCLDVDGFYDDENDGTFKDEPAEALGEADVIWKFDIMNELGVSQHNQPISSVTVVGDLILAGTSHGLGADHIQQPDPAPSFIAVNKNSGRVVWQDSSPTGNLMHGQWSSPAFGVINGVGQAIFAGGDGWIYSFDVRAMTSGKTKLLWKFDGNPKESRWELGGRGTRNNAIAIPVIHGNHVYMSMGQDPEHGEGPGHVWCIDATRRGDISPELVFNKADASKPIPYKRVQACEPDKGDYTKPNPNSGVVWHYHEFDRDGDGKIAHDEKMSRSFSSVVVHDGFAVIPDFAGFVHCLNAETGEPYWVYDMYAQVWGTPLIADGKIYIGDEDGDVSVFALSKELKLLGENVLDRSQYTTIMSAGGTLFVPSVGTLLAIEDPNRKPVAKRPAKLPARGAGRQNWPSPRGNPQNTGVAGGDLPKNLEVLWKMKTKNECEATPAVVDGIAYVGDLQDSLYAIDTRNGQQHWVFRNNCGFQASPLVLGGNVYVGDVDGLMHCFDAATGRQRWKFASGASIACSANAVDGLVVFAAEDGTVFALDPQTGKPVWETSAGTQLQSTPAISGKRVVIAGCDQQLYVLDLETGEQLLTTDIESPTGATPAVRNGLAYFGTLEGVLFCVEIDTGKIRWRFAGKELGQAAHNSAAVTNDLVIVAGRSRNIIAIDIDTGRLVWRYQAKAVFDSSPVVVDDHVVIGSRDGRLYVFDKATGKVKLVHETGSALNGSVAVADGKLVLTTNDGLVYCFGDPKPAAPQTAANPTLNIRPGPEGKRTFRIQSLGGEQLQVENSKQDGKEQLLIAGRCRITFGEGDDAVIAECDRAVIRGAILEHADWEAVEFSLEGDAVLRVGKSELRAEKIRYRPAKRQFEVDGVGTLNLPQPQGGAMLQPETKGKPTGITSRESHQEIVGIGGAAAVLPRDPNATREKVQLAFLGPSSMTVDCLREGNEKEFEGLVAPGRHDFLSATVYRLKLAELPGQEGLTLYPTLEVASVSPRTRPYLAHNAIGVAITEADVEQAAAGNFVTKVMFLPDPQFQELALAGIETVVSTRLDPGVDPIVEAERRGTILAVLRLGNRDVDTPGLEGRILR